MLTLRMLSKMLIITALVCVPRYPKSITSYGDRQNSYEEVSDYFRAHFLQVHRRNDVSKRALYAVSSEYRVLFVMIPD